MIPFVPLFRNPHLQTIAGSFWPRSRRGARFAVERKLFRTEPGVRVLVEIQRPAATPRGCILLVHGLEGAAGAAYMRGLSYRALEQGYTACRMNLRTCGGTEHLANAGYHGGLTSDLLAVLNALAAEGSAPVWLVGFSLGGNLAAKLAGELGADALPLIRGVCAASAAIDLDACARRIGERDNRLYEWHFVRMMAARARAVGGLPRADFRGIRSLVEFDDRITAPAFGFTGAEHYYRTQSACRLLDRIRVPALFIAAKDDTFIPFHIYDQPAFRANRHLRLIATAHGGHLGFIARSRPRLWLDYAIMEWIREQGTSGV